MDIVSEDKIHSPLIRELVDWYDGAKSADKGPSRSDFRPHKFSPAVIPCLFKVQVTRQPFRVLFRAVGERVEESFGFPMTGKYLDEVNIPQRNELLDWYRALLDRSSPIYSKSISTYEGQKLRYEGALFPLGAADDETRFFVGIEHFTDTPSWNSGVRNRSYGAPHKASD